MELPGQLDLPADVNPLGSTTFPSTGTGSHTYDSLKRLAKALNGTHQETDYGYDFGGNLTQLTYPAIGTGSAVNVHRTYDAANRLTAVTDWNNNTTHFSQKYVQL